MSTNVYLKNEIRSSPGFKSAVKPVKGGDSVEEYLFGNIKLTVNNAGRCFVNLSDDNVVPMALVDFVEEISVNSWTPVIPKRERGVYRLESATAEVKDGMFSDKPGYDIVAWADQLSHARDLVRRVKAGSIRPTDSYEGAQTGKSHAELETELEGERVKCEAFQTKLAELTVTLNWEANHRTRYALKLQNAIQFANIIGQKSRWPICRKAWVSGELKAILGTMIEVAVPGK